MKSFFPFHLLCPLSGFLVLAVSSRAQSSPDAATAIPLTTLVAEISANNPELKFYEAEIGAAKAGVRSASALNDPELSFDLGRKRVKDSSGATLGDGTAWSVSVTQTFDWPGRISLRKAIANRDVALAELGAARFQQALAARARTLAYGLYAANAKSAAVREVADRFAALKETFLARDTGGVAPLA
jgi:cobalt-zinc-cadmium efflux system outer membrane protein